MERVTGYAWAALRIAFGGFFILAGLDFARGLITGHPTPHPSTPAGNAFEAALAAAGFVWPTLTVVYLVGGAALLFRRTAPLGLVVLAAPIAVIFGFHTLLAPKLVWAFGWAAAWLALVVHHRRAFAPLWQYRG